MDAVSREMPVVEPACVWEHAGNPAVLGDRHAKTPISCPKMLELSITSVFHQMVMKEDESGPSGGKCAVRISEAPYQTDFKVPSSEC